MCCGTPPGIALKISVWTAYIALNCITGRD
jgi:hypothetical protein